MKTVPWQLRKGRNTDIKLRMVRSALQDAGAQSVIDIGCNAGGVTRGLGAAGLLGSAWVHLLVWGLGAVGMFAVGIEQDLANLPVVGEALQGACLGNLRFSNEVVERMPAFDAALLLSVHHHFIRELGHEEAKALIRALGAKIRRIIIFEVSSKSREYGAEPNALFADEDEASVIAFTRNWLQDALPHWKVEHVWTNLRRPRLSNRYLVTCSR